MPETTHEKNRQPLAGLRVLITREQKQSAVLIKEIASLGGQVTCMPVIDIKPLQNLQPFYDAVTSINHYHFIVFTSPNAVDIAIPLMRSKHIKISDKTRCICVGHGSARALTQHGCALPIVPEEIFTSEGILALPQLSRVKKKNILIIRGLGGRELLGQTLIKRGANVTHAECYERQIAKISATELNDKLNDIDVIVFSSVTALENLFDMIKRNGRQWPTQASFLVTSARIAEALKKKGIQPNRLIVAQHNQEAAIVNALLTLPAKDKAPKL